MANTLLLLSTVTHSPQAIERAIAEVKAAGGKLILLFVVDEELPNSILDRLEGNAFVGEQSGQEVYSALMNEYLRQGKQQLHEIKEQAEQQGLTVETLLKVGDLVGVCIGVIREREIAKAVLTRKRRSHLSRFLFGSPIKKIQDSVDCEFIIVEPDSN